MERNKDCLVHYAISRALAPLVFTPYRLRGCIGLQNALLYLLGRYGPILVESIGFCLANGALVPFELVDQPPFLVVFFGQCCQAMTRAQI